MSAFIVSTDHLDYLVQAALDCGVTGSPLAWPGTSEPVTWETATVTGQRLYAANVASVAHRYGAKADVPDVGAYAFTPYSPFEIDPVQVLKALACLDYQCSGHPDWEASAAHRFCRRLQDRMIGLVRGYRDALWEVTRPQLPDAIARHHARLRAEREDQPDPPVFWTLHALEDGAGVVVAHGARGRILGGHAGFQATDVAAAHARIAAGEGANLQDWAFLSLTPESAAYAAATFPMVAQE